jgi:hypothetical protein
MVRQDGDLGQVQVQGTLLPRTGQAARGWPVAVGDGGCACRARLQERGGVWEVEKISESFDSDSTSPPWSRLQHRGEYVPPSAWTVDRDKARGPLAGSGSDDACHCATVRKEWPAGGGARPSGVCLTDAIPRWDNSIEARLP